MIKSISTLTVILFLFIGLSNVWAAEEVEVLGVKLPTEKTVEGKTLKLNGVAYRKALGFIKVYVVGLYLENPTSKADDVINSEQVKQLYFHYLTNKATAKKLREGFIEMMEKNNPPDMLERNKDDVDLYASWYDKDMKSGSTAVNTYIPGKGMTFEFQGETKGTITNQEFIRMYYQYSFGENADSKMKDGLLGK